ncbi:hypothetical protein D3C78_996570 [compost metagenome]
MADQRDGQPVLADAPGTPDAMDVLVTAARHVEVDHQIDPANIQTARCHVGSNQHVDAALTQALDGQLAFVLGLLAMQHIGLDRRGPQHTRQTIGLDAGIGEHDGLLERFMRQQPLQQPLLVLHIVGRDDLLLEIFVQIVAAVEQQKLRIAQDRARHLPQPPLARGRREQQGLALLRTGLGNLQHVLAEPHIEHAIRLVEHQHLDVAQFQAAGLEMIEHSSRRADHNFGILAQGCSLLLVAFTASHQAGLDEGELGKALDFLERLQGQLAGRQQDQDTRAGLRLAVLQQTVQQRQHEGGRLAAAGLGGHAQVATFKSRRDGSHLNRGWLFEGQRRQRLEQTLMQTVISKHSLPRIMKIAGA